jgi:hypothetical protein
MHHSAQQSLTPLPFSLNIILFFVLLEIYARHVVRSGCTWCALIQRNVPPCTPFPLWLHITVTVFYVFRSGCTLCAWCGTGCRRPARPSPASSFPLSPPSFFSRHARFPIFFQCWDILVVPLTNRSGSGSNSGSDSFLQWLKGFKKIFFHIFFL